MIEFKREAIGVVVRRLRKERKLSQEVLSGFAGIARSHLAMIETGTKLPNFETIWALANAFDLQPHELVLLFEDEAKRMQKEVDIK